jgi:hypothetical protein
LTNQATWPSFWRNNFPNIPVGRKQVTIDFDLFLSVT